MKKYVLCTCDYCQCQFLTDSRHRHARNCRKPDCLRTANRKYAKAYYWRLKNNPKAYGEMLARKRRERALRKSHAVVNTVRKHTASAAEPLAELHPVSSRFVAVVMDAFFRAVTAEHSGFAERFRERLKETADSLRLPELREEMKDFLTFAECLKS